MSVDGEENPSVYHNPKQNAKNALHLCWGNKTRVRLESGGISSSNIAVVGAIHLDFLRRDFLGSYMDKKEIAKKFSLNHEKKWFLYISSFNFVNMTDEEFKQNLECYGDEAVTMRNVSIKSKKQTLQWLEEALQKFPDIEFIYRSHPAENGDPLLDILIDKYDNFHVIGELSVKQWILVCDRICTWYSTSIAEIFFAGKNCIILRPVSIPEKYEISLYRDCNKVTSKEMFFRFLKEENEGFPIKDSLIYEYYNYDKNIPAYIKICDLLETVYKSPKYDMKIPLLLKLKSFKVIYANRMLNVFTKFNYKKYFFWCKWLVSKINRYEESINRVNRNRNKNYATIDEINNLGSIYRDIISGTNNKNL